MDVPLDSLKLPLWGQWIDPSLLAKIPLSGPYFCLRFDWFKFEHLSSTSKLLRVVRIDYEFRKGRMKNLVDVFSQLHCTNGRDPLSTKIYQWRNEIPDIFECRGLSIIRKRSNSSRSRRVKHILSAAQSIVRVSMNNKI